MAVDEVEFREFFASQYVRLCWLGLLLTGDQAEAEELAQEALARTWWRWAVHRPNDPAAYARKVLVNRRRSLLRRAGVEARFLARTTRYVRSETALGSYRSGWLHSSTKTSCTTSCALLPSPMMPTAAP